MCLSMSCHSKSQRKKKAPPCWVRTCFPPYIGRNLELQSCPVEMSGKFLQYPRVSWHRNILLVCVRKNSEAGDEHNSRFMNIEALRFQINS